MRNGLYLPSFEERYSWLTCIRDDPCDVQRQVCDLIFGEVGAPDAARRRCPMVCAHCMALGYDCRIDAMIGSGSLSSCLP